MSLIRESVLNAGCLSVALGVCGTLLIVVGLTSIDWRLGLGAALIVAAYVVDR